MIRSFTRPATGRYGAHMGVYQEFPAEAVAIDSTTGARVEISGAQYPGLSDAQLAEKAVAILRARRKLRRRNLCS